MAGTGRGQSPDLIQELIENPQEFDFFQAVRLIEMYVAQERNHPCPSAIGSDRGPHTEPLSFGTLASLSFPPGQIAALQPSKPEAEASATDAGTPQTPSFPLKMIVSFMGLTGPNGVLPHHYTSLLIERAHQSTKDYALREFFDLFNHRAISLFFRAWEKYRFPFEYERNLHDGVSEDGLFTRCLFSLVGLQVKGLRHRFDFDDQTVVSHGGIFAQNCRNAAGLEQVLGHYFQIDAEVVQFCGQWLYLPEDTQSRMPSKQHREGLNLQLGESAVVGSRVWDVQSRVRIRLGPLGIADFNKLVPGRDQLTAVAELIRFYIGADKDFDVQLVLRKEDIVPCQLVARNSYEPRLGWNTWMASDARPHDAEDAVFRF
jgi:type VI secretion system protein ImpH